MSEKRLQSGNEGETLDVGKTENLSSSLHNKGDAARPGSLVGRDVAPDIELERDQFDRREDEHDRPL